MVNTRNAFIIIIVGMWLNADQLLVHIVRSNPDCIGQFHCLGLATQWHIVVQGNGLGE